MDGERIPENVIVILSLVWFVLKNSWMSSETNEQLTCRNFQAPRIPII